MTATEPATSGATATVSAEVATVAVLPLRESAPAPLPSPAAPRLVDRHRDLGIDFQFDNGASGRAFMVESTGGGGGWCDYDRDGWPDLYLVQGGDPLLPVPHVLGDRLLRNFQGRQFVDVTDHACPVDPGYGQGLAVADYDADGFPDILVTNIGADVLLHNQGDGTFVDITAAAGLGDPRWGSSAAWADLDSDGDLDLFICNYLDYDVHHPLACQHPDGRPAICHPESVPAGRSECYENLGDGRFQPVSERWGLVAPENKALGVVVADFNGDRQPDIYVANDTTANHLFVRQSPGHFTESAILLGCAVNSLGQYQASMGIACNDYDQNGFLDLYVTHFTHDSNTLYANLGPAGFRDVTRWENLHQPTLDLLGFGTVMTDLNADGAMDLFVANGHIDDWSYKGEPWKMRPQLFSYRGDAWVEHRADTVGPFLDELHLGRAVSMADMDRDGDLDLLVVHQDAPAALLVNESPRGHWLMFDFLGRGLNREGIGVTVEVRQAGRRYVQQLVAGGSYCSAHEPLLHFGLGASAEPCDVVVTWPQADQPTPVFTVDVDQRLTVREP